jgi:uncharacterized phage protein (TIGR02220 family)
MANPWFRLYAEFAHDPKVQMLSEALQRRYVMLLCFKCNGSVTRDSNGCVTEYEKALGFSMRISDQELAETKQVFIAKGFIDDQWNLINWDKRQFISDQDLTRNERQKRHREKQAEEKRNALRNAPVTLLDTDTDTDITTTSGKPDLALQAKEVIDYLNQKTESSFRHVDANIKPIIARIKETDLDTVKAVIDDRCSAWLGDKKMEEYLRPATLFNAQKFASYSGASASRSIKPWEQ